MNFRKSPNTDEATRTTFRFCDVNRFRIGLTLLACMGTAAAAAAEDPTDDAFAAPTDDAPQSIQLGGADQNFLQIGTALDEFDDYTVALRKVFNDVFAPAVRARALVRPSFYTEYAVAISEAQASYEILTLLPAQPIWRHEERPPGSGNFYFVTDVSDLTVERCETGLDADVARRTLRIFETMLRQERPEQIFGYDGTTYEFSMTVNDENLVGQSWSPDEGTHSERLVSIFDTMYRTCSWMFPLSLYFRHSLGTQVNSLAEELSIGPQ